MPVEEDRESFLSAFLGGQMAVSSQVPGWVSPALTQLSTRTTRGRGRGMKGGRVGVEGSSCEED